MFIVIVIYAQDEEDIYFFKPLNHLYFSKFKIDLHTQSCNVNFSGEGGIGKSSTMAYLALNWASGDDEVLRQFDLLFNIKLSEVTGKDRTLEEIITEQHEELCGMEEQLKHQLQDSYDRLLLILDGLDEYAMGTNIVIDNIVNNKSNATKCETCVIITSRSEAQNLHLVSKQMNKIILARGFDKKRIKQCAKNFFRSVGNEKDASKFLKKDILELLRVPIILVMAYLLYQEQTEHSLPTSKSAVVGEIIDLILDRKKSSNLTEEQKKNIKIKVGEKAWAATQNSIMVLEKVPVQQLLAYLCQKTYFCDSS